MQSGATPASGSVPAPASAPIRLVDLATQHSGLPRLPSNLDAQADPGNPYAHYGSKKLLAFLAVHGVARPVQAPFGYSNFGYGLLGWVLARRAGLSYAALVQREITGPLGMSDTVIALTAGQKRRLVQGYSQAGRPVETWDLNALAGAGGLRSTAGDLLKLLRAELHPPQAMAAAVRMTQQLRADGPAPLKVGLGWLYTPASQTYWHDGGTGGYTSFALFRPGEDYAVVVLYNREDIGAPQGPFSDRVAANVSALLAGVPALKLGK
ncbi:MAG: serine hydrolase domain-containing protein [Terriglobales bacterium]